VTAEVLNCGMLFIAVLLEPVFKADERPWVAFSELTFSVTEIYIMFMACFCHISVYISIITREDSLTLNSHGISVVIVKVSDG
jgi:hypothetical protein